MKNMLTAIVGLMVMIVLSEAVTKQDGPAAKEVAAAYFEALVKGDVEKADALVTAPYSFDRREILQTKEKIAKMHRDIAGDKGERIVPKYTVSVPKNATELDRKVFPEYTVFRISIAGEDEHVDIYVTKGSHPKVIGCSDRVQ